MKVLILTTDTSHHNYFIRQLMKFCSQMFVVYETTEIIPRYPTYHPFEGMRKNFEVELWGNKSSKLRSNEVDYLNHMPNINEISSIEKLLPQADVCIVFGTRKIQQLTIDILPRVTVNLHGGDPELYRGLDSHLWALWHRDNRGLKTCLHFLSPELDTGKIIQINTLDIASINSLHELRALNTLACIELCVDFLRSLHTGNVTTGGVQNNLGRYYSFMPSDLKQIVLNIFEKKLKGKLL